MNLLYVAILHLGFRARYVAFEPDVVNIFYKVFFKRKIGYMNCNRHCTLYGIIFNNLIVVVFMT